MPSVVIALHAALLVSWSHHSAGAARRSLEDDRNVASKWAGVLCLCLSNITDTTGAIKTTKAGLFFFLFLKPFSTVHILYNSSRRQMTLSEELGENKKKKKRGWNWLLQQRSGSKDGSKTKTRVDNEPSALLLRWRSQIFFLPHASVGGFSSGGWRRVWGAVHTDLSQPPPRTSVCSGTLLKTNTSFHSRALVSGLCITHPDDAPATGQSFENWK